MRTEANFSPCRKYRYWLLRVWDENLPLCGIVGLNPSVANETDNDPTITKEITFSRSWGFGGILKQNLYAYCATDPKNMWAARKWGVNVEGPNNYLEDIVERFINQFPQVGKVVAAWGNDGGDRGVQLGRMGLKMDCLKKNSDGSPAHPLYLPYGLLLEPWNYKSQE